ncbi:LLM class flavin-dependent oxidoreductase [Tepidiforma sp.]|uniref:LLM class flavin-dependent oxidoreductase n=1 Tax=Tepidiforma sp. TaxID=2682230 RepID=UPI002ADE3801|nr:LLM class flavin-dependent oxidoreductase [Tepidiforma sp.]
MNGVTVGVHILARTAPELVEGIVAAEQAGIQCAWLTVGGLAPDPFAVFGAAATRTSRIQFGTSIVPTFPRHPLAMAQGAMAVDQLAPGRLRLGVGPSHKPVIEGTWGIPFERPLEHLREYLTILKSVLGTGSVDFQGRRFTARGTIGAPAKVTVMASALRANGFRLAGELADGAISWVCPLPYLRDVAVPAIRAGAEKAGRTPPPLIAHIPVVVSEHVEAVREGARRQIGIYPRVPFYQQMFADAGFPEALNGELSDRIIDALVVHGSAEAVKARLREAPSFGAGEILAMPILPPGDAEALPRTLRALGELAAE